MKSSFFAIVVALSSSVLCTAQTCINQTKADDVVSKFSTIMFHKNTTQSTQIANALLTADIKDYSDSILSLQGKPLGQPTFVNRTDFLNQVFASPAPKTITNLYVGTTNCTSVVWQWKFTGVGSGEYDVRGLTIFKLNKSGVVYEIYVEFNSLAWARDIGFTVTPPQMTTTTTAKAGPTSAITSRLGSSTLVTSSKGAITTKA